MKPRRERFLGRTVSAQWRRSPSRLDLRLRIGGWFESMNHRTCLGLPFAWLIFLGSVGVGCLLPVCSAPPVTSDLCVYGATPAGIAAAATVMYVDGSYEGDLMAMAGESYHVGREARAQYGEPMAGDERGQADGQVQGYNYRFIMTQVETNRIMPTAPAGYQRENFVGVLTHFDSGRLRKVFSDGHDGIYRAHIPLLPNGKTDVNDTPHAPVRLSMPDVNDAYPDGDAAMRQAIVVMHFDYNVGRILRPGPTLSNSVRRHSAPKNRESARSRRMLGQSLWVCRSSVGADLVCLGAGGRVGGGIGNGECRGGTGRGYRPVAIHAPRGSQRDHLCE
jgi:hypothetical protein